MPKKPYWGVVPQKIRGKKLHGKIVLAMWNQFDGRAEFTAEFPFEYRGGNEVLRLTTYMYPPGPEVMAVNGIILKQFGKMLGVDLAEPGKLEAVASIADLEHREIEIDAVVDVGVKGSSYYRMYEWKINDTPTKVLHKASYVRPEPKDAESRQVEKLESELRTARFLLNGMESELRKLQSELLEYKCRLEDLFHYEELYEMFPDLYYPVQDCELEVYDDNARGMVPISEWAAKELEKRRQEEPPPDPESKPRGNPPRRATAGELPRVDPGEHETVGDYI